jgi:hypothetical protein
MHRPLQPLHPRARDRRCPSQSDRDNARLAWLLVGHKNGRHLCGASRSGPVPMKLDWRGSARKAAPPRSHSSTAFQGQPRRAASLRGDASTMRTGFQAIQGCARGSQRLQSSAVVLDFATRQACEQGRTGEDRRSESQKSVALDGAASCGGSSGSCRGGVGGQTPEPRGESATEGVRGRTPTFPPGRQRREEGALLGELRKELTRTGQGFCPRETEGIRWSSLKLWSRRQTRLYSITLWSRFRPGRWRGSCSFERKLGRAVIREPSDLAGCSWCKSVADLG